MGLGGVNSRNGCTQSGCTQYWFRFRVKEYAIRKGRREREQISQNIPPKKLPSQPTERPFAKKRGQDGTSVAAKGHGKEGLNQNSLGVTRVNLRFRATSDRPGSLAARAPTAARTAAATSARRPRGPSSPPRSTPSRS